MAYVAVFLGLLLVVLAVKTLLFRPVKVSVQQEEQFNMDLEGAARRLAGAVQIPTVSTSDPADTDWAQFERFHAYLAENYPLVHARTELEKINDYGLLYRWRGSPGGGKPFLLMAHQDVVPVEEDAGDWRYPPFSGEIIQGELWGRGALDIKVLLIAIMESLENLLAQGFIPARDIYLFFGQDEEVGGKLGAIAAAELLHRRGVEFELIVDEGGLVVDGILPRINKPLALVGVCEKGYANIRLTAEDTGGHSSMPPRSTALGAVSAAVVRLERRPMKPRLSPPVREFFRRLGPELKGLKVVIANLWLFKPLFVSLFARTRTGNALLRTTTAATMAHGAPEPNVLPQKASVVLNFRIAPGDTVEKLLRHTRKTINNPGIKVEPFRLYEPSAISPIDCEPYRLIERIACRLYPEALVAPYLVMAGTDSRKFENVCRNIYRFGAYRLNTKELQSIHGTGERISLENLERCIRFYTMLIKAS